jgi:hypothetical protein
MSQTMAPEDASRLAAEVRRTLLAAARPIDGIRIDMAATPADSGFRVSATYRISLSPEARGRYVVFDYSKALPPLHVKCVEAPVREISTLVGQWLFLIELTNDGSTPPVIHVELAVDWKVGLAPPAYPYLIANTFLPRVLVPRASEIETSVAPRFVWTGDIPTDLQLIGVQLDAGEWDPVHRAQVELVLVPRNDVICDAETGVMFLGDGVKTSPAEPRQKVAAAMQKNLRILAGEFGLQPSLRTAAYVCLANEGRLGGSRALLVQDADYLGLDGKLGRLTSHGLARQARIWWGGGVQLEGSLGEAIGEAVGLAVVLRQMEAQGRKVALAYIEYAGGLAALALDRKSERAKRASKLIGELSLALYAAMRERPAVVAALRAMTREYWGRHAPATLVLARLHEVGVGLPNGTHGLSACE